MRRPSALLLALLAFLGAGMLATGAATGLVRVIETQSRERVAEALNVQAIGWAEVHVDGLQVILSGTAPDEGARARALNMVGGIVDFARVVDGVTVADAANIPAPHFAIEILRNGDQISLIGLVPRDGRAAVTEALSTAGADFSDMLDTADSPAPEGWDRALSFGLAAVRALPRAKVSITAAHVAVTATAPTPDARAKAEALLERQRPAGVGVAIAITAPRPVIAPFALSATMEGGVLRLDTCAADSEAALARIRTATAATALAAGAPACTLALGAPSPLWGEAAALGLAALRELGAGTLSLSDADVTLSATGGAEGAGPATFDAAIFDAAAFDRTAARLREALPAPFSLVALRPVVAEAAVAGAAEFAATLSPEGRVTLEGRLMDARQQATLAAYAQSRFGAGAVAVQTETTAGLPEGWGLRALAGIEALSLLHEGRLDVTPSLITVTGVSGRPDAAGEIMRRLSERLGAEARANLAVRYDKTLDPQAAGPTPQECVATLNTILQGDKVTFAPGSATIESRAQATLDAVARAALPCVDVRMEIGGHTDAQGRDEMNLQLSQARAEAVLEALLARRVPIANLSAQGYGETQPLAANGNETGREANRRIEFKLLVPAGTAAAAPVGTPAGSPAGSPAVAPGAPNEPQTAPPTEPQTVPQTEPVVEIPLEEEDQPMDDVTEGHDGGPPEPQSQTEARPVTDPVTDPAVDSGPAAPVTGAPATANSVTPDSVTADSLAADPPATLSPQRAERRPAATPRN